jgi:hypothetical protein
VKEFGGTDLNSPISLKIDVNGVKKDFKFNLIYGDGGVNTIKRWNSVTAHYRDCKYRKHLIIFGFTLANPNKIEVGISGGEMHDAFVNSKEIAGSTKEDLQAWVKKTVDEIEKGKKLELTTITFNYKYKNKKGEEVTETVTIENVPKGLENAVETVWPSIYKGRLSFNKLDGTIQSLENKDGKMSEVKTFLKEVENANRNDRVTRMTKNLTAENTRWFLYEKGKGITQIIIKGEVLPKGLDLKKLTYFSGYDLKSPIPLDQFKDNETFL